MGSLVPEMQGGEQVASDTQEEGLTSKRQRTMPGWQWKGGENPGSGYREVSKSGGGRLREHPWGWGSSVQGCLPRKRRGRGSQSWCGGGGLAWPLQREGSKGSKEVQTECECARTHAHACTHPQDATRSPRGDKSSQLDLLPPAHLPA